MAIAGVLSSVSSTHIRREGPTLTATGLKTPHTASSFDLAASRGATARRSTPRRGPLLGARRLSSRPTTWEPGSTSAAVHLSRLAACSTHLCRNHESASSVVVCASSRHECHHCTCAQCGHAHRPPLPSSHRHFERTGCPRVLLWLPYLEQEKDGGELGGPNTRQRRRLTQEEHLRGSQLELACGKGCEWSDQSSLVGSTSVTRS